MEEKPFAKIAIIGTGLIGASFGLACMDRRLGQEVVGFDISEDRTREAKEIGALTQAAATLREAVTEADLIILAAPVGEISSIFQQAVPYFSDGSIVTDVGSAKSRIVDEIGALCPP
ncbi:MAG TPA: prephenate dehydrogenase/arogenate dehydrogenase family protein, partial [Actinomycetota bacterium]|nr:prephenate dehydrogenase/arogenate dehydrogenase family protein [Actinomycetota bacterium]